MKILWISNVSLLTKKINSTGTWIHSMYEQLKTINDVVVSCNITLGNTRKIVQTKDGIFTQYEIPRHDIYKNGLPKSNIYESIVRVIISEDPDLIHVWGIELFWGLVAQDSRLKKYPILIEIQGIKSISSKPLYFYGGLSQKEIKSTRGLVEFIYPAQYVINLQKNFEKWSIYESLILKNAKYISTQSDWVRSIIRNDVSKKAKIYNTGIILRKEFTSSNIWSNVHKRSEEITIFSVTSGRVYKAAHVTLRAFALVKKKYPNAKLRFAGISKHPNPYKRSGYFNYLTHLIKELNLEDSVNFLGALQAKDLLKEFYNADLCVNSSFVETYCLALAEALSLGVPCVAAYTSALPELMEHGKSGLFYPMGDYYICAERMLQYIENPNLCKQVSITASQNLRQKSNEVSIVNQQINIYKSVLSDGKC